MHEMLAHTLALHARRHHHVAYRRVLFAPGPMQRGTYQFTVAQRRHALAMRQAEAPVFQAMRPPELA
jgi:hypothetical protein